MPQEPWVVSIVTLIVTVLASSGFWAYVLQHTNKKSATTKLLMGLAHKEILESGMRYIDRGWVSKDEYEDLVRYLYEPYQSFGGNGVAEKVVSEVRKLPMYNTTWVSSEKEKQNG